MGLRDYVSRFLFAKGKNFLFYNQHVVVATISQTRKSFMQEVLLNINHKHFINKIAF